MRVPTNLPWSSKCVLVIRKLLNHRPLVQTWIKDVIGNGASMFLWVENWHPHGSHVYRYGDRVV